jgi:hypothetical protein
MTVNFSTMMALATVVAAEPFVSSLLTMTVAGLLRLMQIASQLLFVGTYMVEQERSQSQSPVQKILPTVMKTKGMLDFVEGSLSRGRPVGMLVSSMVHWLILGHKPSRNRGSSPLQMLEESCNW